MTIREVAELAGVSIATVSRVANGHSDVSRQTREAVQRVIRERGYLSARPRAEPTAPSGLVGVTLPMIHPAYFAELLSGIAEALSERQLRAVLCPTHHSHAREMSLLDQLAGGDCDGAILVLPEESGAELVAQASGDFPFVVVDPLGEVPEGVPVVCAAHSSGAAQATRHLLDLGHRRIGVIAGPHGWMASEDRLRGYRAAMASAGMLADQALIEHADFRVDGGRESARRLLGLDDPPTAIFAFNDRMAIGVIQSAASAGLRVPADLSVVGFDDTADALIGVPPLTTVRQHLAEMGRTAVSMLLRQIENRRYEPLRVELETRLVIRESTAARGRP
ncbi:MAG TPA: LacI family DNA-binding transcriptional regulator [Streptosporangiaceae bacterium]|nr:LacI family DNA-binding transcriptional regulator [Streptosporangiaceae bacterium]